MSFWISQYNIFGLDIDDFALRAVRAEKGKRKPKIAAYGEKKLPEGVIKNGIVKNMEKLSLLIENLLFSLKRGKIKTPFVALSLPDHQSYIDTIQIPRVKSRELEETVKREMENHIPYSLDRVYYDFGKITPKNSQEKSQKNYEEIIITAIPKEIADGYLEAAERANLEPVALEVGCISSCRSLLSQKVPINPAAIVEIKKDRTIFTVYAGQSIRLSSSFEFYISPEIESKETPKNKKKQMLKGLIDKISELIDYYRSYELDDNLLKNSEFLEKIILDGEGANLEEILELFEQKFNFPIKKGNPFTNLEKNSNLGLSSKNALMFSSAVGLSLINFYD